MYVKIQGFMQKIVSTKLLALLFPAFGFLGCMVGPDFESPEPPKTEKYTDNPLPEETVAIAGVQGGAAQEFKVGEEIPEKWWERFHSPELNALIERGFENNPNLRSAVATLWVAEEDLRTLIGETMYPAVGANIYGGREQLSSFESLEGTPGTTQGDFPRQLLTMYNANVDVAYVFDVFGGNRRAIEALQARVNYELYELEATYLTLAGNIVTTAIREASLREQIIATKQIIKKEEKQLNIFKKQLKAGGISTMEILSQETILAQERATLPALENNLALTRHALAVLVGEYPGTDDLPEFHLKDIHLPEELPVSLPSTLVRQRPDIRAAEALLHQASAQIGVATANMLPTFPIVGSYGPLSDTLSDFFALNNISWTWRANIVQPIFNGGALLAQREASIAAFEAALAGYESAVLIGLQNVADSLSAVQFDALTLQESAAAEKAAKETMNLMQRKFKAGAVNNVDLILAEILYEQTYIQRILAQTARYVDTAALFQALGGGWWQEIDDTEIEDD